MVETAKGLKVGDWVKVAVADKDWEYWSPDMDSTVGQVGKVSHLRPLWIDVDFGDDRDLYSYTSKCLQALPDPGEGYRIIDQTVDKPQYGDEVWLVIERAWHPRVYPGHEFDISLHYRRRLSPLPQKSDGSADYLAVTDSVPCPETGTHVAEVVYCTDTLHRPTGDAVVHDPVNFPKHYTSHPSGIECIQITEHMGFNCGNALKYVWRADLKGDAIEDLKKARWYIERELAKRGAK